MWRSPTVLSNRHLDLHLPPLPRRPSRVPFPRHPLDPSSTSATASTLPNGFSSLTNLSVHYLNAPSLAGAVRAWRFPRLQSFAAHQIMRAGVDQVGNLLLALRDHVSHGTLRSLHLRGT